MPGLPPKPQPLPVAPERVPTEDVGPPTQSLPGHIVADIQRRLRGTMPEPPLVVAAPIAAAAAKVDLNKRVMMMTSPLTPELPVAIAGSAPSTGTLPLPDSPRPPSDPPADARAPSPPLDARTRRSKTIEE